MPLPLIAAVAGKAGLATKAGTALKAAKAAKLAKTASKISSLKGKLSIGMLGDDKVNTYPGAKLDKFKKKTGEYLKRAASNTKEAKFSEPTKADASPSSIYSGSPENPNDPNDPSNVYSKQIQKLESMR